MEKIRTDCRLEAEHGVVSGFPDDYFGYYGWPSVAKLGDGTLVAAASGLRNAHVCPFGRNVILVSRDEGRSWSSPRVVNDSPLDDRDTGAVCLGGHRLLLSWFTSDNRRPLQGHNQEDSWQTGLAWATDEVASRWIGAWVCRSDDGGESWERPVRAPLNAPHGPIRRRDGSLLYLGKDFRVDRSGFRAGKGAMEAAVSMDDGTTWEELGPVPLYDGTHESNYHEAHVAELPDGKLVGLLRFELGERFAAVESDDLTRFSMFQTRSEDGGRTWTKAEPLGFHGCPPHLMVHSSGALVCTYGRRQEPYGQRVMVSHDGGDTWTYDHVLRDDGPDTDLGYPASIEMDDGSLFTVYYQKQKSVEEKCSLLWSRWQLPG
jgi:sialidase-1